MPHHRLRPIPHLRPPNLNLDASNPPSVPSRPKLVVEIAAKGGRNLKPIVKDHLVVARLQKLVAKAARPLKPTAMAPHVVDPRQRLAVKEIVMAQPNPVTVKTVPRCIAMAVVNAALDHMTETVVTSPALVTVKSILQCIAKEIATAHLALAMVKKASLLIKAPVVNFMLIVVLVMATAARSRDLATASRRSGLKVPPHHTSDTDIAIMAVASDPTHALASARSNPVVR
jgi:hypothetical protein